MEKKIGSAGNRLRFNMDVAAQKIYYNSRLRWTTISTMTTAATINGIWNVLEFI